MSTLRGAPHYDAGACTVVVSVVALYCARFSERCSSSSLVKFLCSSAIATPALLRCYAATAGLLLLLLLPLLLLLLLLLLRRRLRTIP